MDKKQSSGNLLSEKEAAAKLGVSERTLFNLRRRGELKFCPIGSRILYPEQALEEFVQARMTAASI